MKLKIFTALLSVLVIALTIVSCVSLPLETSHEESSRITDPSHGESSAKERSSPEESSADTPALSGEEPVSDEPSQSVPSEEPSDEPPSEEPSREEPSKEEPSQPPAEESSAEASKEETSAPAGEYALIPDVEGIPYTTYEGITEKSIKASEYDAYYRDSMFIGLSIFVHFTNYKKDMTKKYPDFLGNAIIFARSNFSAYNNFRYKPSDEDSVHPLYKGEKMTCEDAVKASGVKTVYLSIMALNELGIYSSNCVDRTYETTVKLINAIKEKSPAVNIVILSNTYMVYDFNNYKNLNNANISALNNKVLEYCNANGMDFIDVSTMLMDGNVLADKYCRDAHSGSGCHLNNDGFAIWTAVLRNYAFLKQKGLYKNPASMPTYTKNK